LRSAFPSLPITHGKAHNREYNPHTVDTILLDTGNVFLSLSGFLMLHTAYKDRRVLRGYNPLGTGLILLAIGLAMAFYAQQGYWASLALTLPNYAYWLVVGASILRNRLARRVGPLTTQVSQSAS